MHIWPISRPSDRAQLHSGDGPGCGIAGRLIDMSTNAAPDIADRVTESGIPVEPVYGPTNLPADLDERLCMCLVEGRNQGQRRLDGGLVGADEDAARADLPQIGDRAGRLR